MRALSALACLLVLALGCRSSDAVRAAAQPGSSEDMSKLVIPEEHTVEVLPKAGDDRLYVLDMAFSHAISGKAYAVDGRRGRVAGMISAGYMPNLAISPDHEELYVLGTFFERGARGKRTDVAVFYDARTLSPTGEVVLRDGRFLVADKGHNVDLTTDGRYLLSTNMTPATSVSVVDVVERRYVGAVETPGCTLVFPSGPSRFSSLCADGSLFTATFNAHAEASAARSKPLFDVIEDPVFEHAGVDRANRVFHFITYSGMIQSADLSSERPSFAEPWSILTEADAKKGWLPGGWELIAYQAASRRLFVLMHQGGAWTHKKDGDEVWVFDVDARERTARIPLSKPSKSIAVTQGTEPVQLYAMAKNELMIYDVEKRELVKTVGEMGKTPLEIIVHNR